MTLPSIISFTIKMPQPYGEILVTWDSDGQPGKTYFSGVNDMEAQVYKWTPPEIEETNYKWGIINNKDTDAVMTEKAVTDCLKAYSAQVLSEYYGLVEEGAGIGWPITALMISEPNASHRPRGAAAAIRMIDDLLVPSTSIGLPVYFGPQPAPE